MRQLSDLNINLINFRLVKVSFSVEDQTILPPDKSIVEISLSVNHKYYKKEKKLLTLLTVEIKEKDDKWILELEVVGEFTLNIEPDKKELHWLGYIHCPFIMQPYLRNEVSEITRKAGIANFNMPVFDFAELEFGRQNKRN